MSTDPLHVMIARDATRWYLRHRTRLQHTPPAVLLVAVVVALFTVAGVLFAAWHAANGLTHATTDAVRTVATSQLAHTVLDPVDAYLHANTAGLPVTGAQLWTTWAGATLTLFSLALFGSRGGRIGWAVMGALTVGMVFAGTLSTGSSRAVAAGLAATLWALLSVPAFAYTRRGRTPTRTVIVQQPTQPRTHPTRPINDGAEAAPAELAAAIAGPVPRF